jgi:hypothetical protein
MPRAFEQPAKRCRSFSAFWKEAAGEAPTAHWRG